MMAAEQHPFAVLLNLMDKLVFSFEYVDEIPEKAIELNTYDLFHMHHSPEFCLLPLFLAFYLLILQHNLG